MCFAPQRRALFRHFFDISTSKSGPSMWCFVHFDLEMCFAPQRRALFRHLNFQKWSENGVFCTFWLGNVLRATTACTFSTSQLPKVVRSWCVLYILTSKCASRHNGVHFFISHLARCLRTRRFSEPTFRPSGATNHWKNTVNRDFQCFTHLHLLSSDLFSSDSSHLCFSTVHIVGSFTSKLPSMNGNWVQYGPGMSCFFADLEQVSFNAASTFLYKISGGNIGVWRSKDWAANAKVKGKRKCFIMVLLRYSYWLQLYNMIIICN